MDSNQIVSQLNSTVNSFKNNVTVEVRKMDDVTSRIEDATIDIYRRLEKFKNDMIRGEDKQIAHENVIALDQEINERLAQYQTVRHSVIGVIRDFDISLVRSTTITELSEELWMNTSRYWLSFVLIALAAWIQNDQELANNATMEALKADPVKTSLFYSLMYMRFNRTDVAKRWLFVYFDNVDPKRPPNETEIVLKSFLYGVFGTDPDLENSVKQIIESWIDTLHMDANQHATITNNYYTYIDNMHSSANVNLPNLTSYMQNYEQAKTTLDNANKLPLLCDFLDTINVDAPEITAGNYRARLDNVLNDLITNFDEKELELKNKQKFYQLIMDNDGDTEAAKKQFAELQKFNGETADIASQMIHWALYNTDSDPLIKKYAVTHTKVWFKTAVNKFAAHVSENRPVTYDMHIDLYDGELKSTSKEDAIKDLEHEFARKRMSVVVFTKMNIIMMIIGLALLTIGAVVLTLASNTVGIVILVGGSVALVIPIVLAIMGLVRYPKRIEKARAALSDCVDELAKFETDVDTLLAYSKTFDEKISTFSI